MRAAVCMSWVRMVRAVALAWKANPFAGRVNVDERDLALHTTTACRGRFRCPGKP